LEFGIYQDDCDHLSPEEIEENYGLFGAQRRRMPGQTGAGHPDDEDDFDMSMVEEGTDEWIDIDGDIFLETDPNIRHEPVSVPDHRCPFSLDGLDAFSKGLRLYIERDYTPPGLGMCSEEWENGQYPSIQVIPSGRRGSKELPIQLPHELWLPRSQLWVRGLHVLNFIQNRQNLGLV